MFGANPEASGFGRFLNLISDITTHGIGDLGKGESCNLHDAPHLPLGFINTPSDL